MTSVDRDLLQSAAKPAGQGPSPATGGWGNSAPLGLAAFAVTTFMLSMINAKLMPAEITPVVFGVALMYGGVAQLIAGVIQFRTGNTFTGVLFSTFGAFWLSLFAIVQFFLKDIPAAQHGQALGLFLYGFGIFTVWIAIASFRTNAVVVVALAGLAATLFVLGAGNYDGSGLTVETGGYMGLVVAALAAYLSCAELCEASYKRAVLPLFPLAKH
jgi:succinate-acetate transporter protein